MKERVLITGASSGLGYEMAKVFAQNGFDLVLVARREEKLKQLSEELRQRYRSEVYVIAADLSDPSSAQQIYEELKGAGIEVSMLVNNAGFGDHGEFVNSDLKLQKDMIEVNIGALVSLTHLFARDMVGRNRGGILNIASVAGFQPGPYMAIYYATKAFVVSFSDALSYELKGTGVWVTTVCPGPTKTEFEATAKASKLFEHFQVAKAQDVALFCYRSFRKKKGIAVPGLLNRVMVILQKFSPRSVLKFVASKIQR